MLKNLFLPEKIGAYYLFSQRTIGFDIGKTHITATQVLLNGRAVTVEKVITESLAQGTIADYHNRVADALRSILTKVDKYDAITTTLSASVIFFKELSLPFVSRDKIKLVLEYEVERLLPFSIDQAVMDFIITGAKNDKTTILVAATQKMQIAEHIAFFETAGVTPDRITVDLFSLYGLFKEIPTYADKKTNTVLTVIGFSSTKIAYVLDGKLALIRTIPKGVASFVKDMSDRLEISPHDAHEQLMRFGFEKKDSDYSKVAHEALQDFLTPFEFTLNSFSKETKKEAQRVLLLGGGAEIKNIEKAISKKIGIPVALFNTDSLINHAHVKIKDKHHLDPQAIVSLSAALPTSVNEVFNLKTKEFAEDTTKFFAVQGVTAITLIVLTLGALITNNFYQIRKLNSSIATSEKQMLTAIQDGLGISGVRRVEYAVEEASRLVEEQEKTWFAFTGQTRSSFLKQLQILSRYIDKKAIGLQLKKLTLTHDTIKLQGEVKDIPSLVILEEDLKQTNLGTFSSPQEPQFTITIAVKKKEMEE
jgi:type IV pilus assembly protein PilM